MRNWSWQKKPQPIDWHHKLAKRKKMFTFSSIEPMQRSDSSKEVR